MLSENKVNKPNFNGVRINRPAHLRRLYFLIVPLLLLMACNFSSTIRFLSTPLTQRSLSVQLATLPVGAHAGLPTFSTPTPVKLKTPPSPPTAQPPAAGYQVSAEIVQLADEAAMTAKARELFFSTHPEIDTDRTTFEKHCQTQVMKNMIELGCFTTDNHIYILKLNDPRFQPEMPVIAAHEMLHVAYAHLSASDRTAVDSQLEAVVPGIQDAELLQRLKSYRTLEPGQRDNELHSILGTEYAALGPDLEQYYSLYFSDNRRAVVSDAQQFNQIFSQRDTELANLQAQIRKMRKEMQADLARHDNAAYNQLVPQINALVKQYNQVVQDYNAFSRELMGEEPAVNQQ
jgi:uncharacterized protein YukE